MPEPLNPLALPTELNTMVDEKTGVNLSKVKAKMANEGIYVTHKKKKTK